MRIAARTVKLGEDCGQGIAALIVLFLLPLFGCSAERKPEKRVPRLGLLGGAGSARNVGEQKQCRAAGAPPQILSWIGR